MEPPDMLLFALFVSLLIGIESVDARWPGQLDCGKHESFRLTNDLQETDGSGGFDTKSRYFPSYARVSTQAVSYIIQCAGVLISDRNVLVHSHCFSRRGPKFQPTEVELGFASESARKYGVEQHCYSTSPSFGIQGYAVEKDGYDILRLNESVMFDENIQPACLAHSLMKKPLAGGGELDRRQAYLVLYWQVTGQEFSLRAVPVKQASCSSPLDQSQHHFCMRSNFPKYRGYPCAGDKGAPLLVEVNGRHVVMGLLRSHRSMEGPMGGCRMDDSTDYFATIIDDNYRRNLHCLTEAYPRPDEDYEEHTQQKLASIIQRSTSYASC